MEKINLKTDREIASMAKAGRRLSEIRNLLLKKVKPGIKTIELDQLAEKEIVTFGGQPSFKTVRNYQHTVCVSINEEVVHGIPGLRRIEEGDLVAIDLGMVYEGLHTDTAWTVLVVTQKPKIKTQKQEEIQRFLTVGEEALNQAIAVVRAGRRIGHISQVIEEKIKKAGYSPVRVLTGHGVGRVLHEEPAIPGVLLDKIEKTPEIVSGMTLAIEVIYSFGFPEVSLKDDQWTIVTADGKISATFEKSIAVSDNGVLVLTP